MKSILVKWVLAPLLGIVIGFGAIKIMGYFQNRSKIVASARRLGFKSVTDEKIATEMLNSCKHGVTKDGKLDFYLTGKGMDDYEWCLGQGPELANSLTQFVSEHLTRPGQVNALLTYFKSMPRPNDPTVQSNLKATFAIWDKNENLRPYLRSFAASGKGPLQSLAEAALQNHDSL